MEAIRTKRGEIHDKVTRAAGFAALAVLGLLVAASLFWWGPVSSKAQGPPPPTVIHGKNFSLSSDYGARETIEFQVNAPVLLTLSATWTGPADTLALILNGPGQEAFYARRDGPSRLSLDYRVRPEDLRRGTRWKASIVNFTRRGPAQGRLQITYPAAPAYSCTFLNDYPRNRDIAWGEECQGLANSSDHWYISQKEKLWKFPVTHDLSPSTASAVTTGIPDSLARAGYNHFGDPDFHNGSLFVPLEGRQPCRIVVFDAGLRFLAHAGLGEQGHASWCAINPADGLLYSSEFDGVESLLGYRWLLGGGSLTLTFVRRLPLLDAAGRPMRINRIQGGAFSRTSGLFYLVSDTGSSGGLYAFDASTGKLIQRTSIGYSPGSPNYQELEGLTIWDLDSGRAPNIRGQVHVVLIENDVTSVDDVWIKHFRVPHEIQ